MPFRTAITKQAVVLPWNCFSSCLELRSALYCRRSAHRHTHARDTPLHTPPLLFPRAGFLTETFRKFTDLVTADSILSSCYSLYGDLLDLSISLSFFPNTRQYSDGRITSPGSKHKQIHCLRPFVLFSFFLFIIGRQPRTFSMPFTRASGTFCLLVPQSQSPTSY